MYIKSCFKIALVYKISDLFSFEQHNKKDNSIYIIINWNERNSGY